MAHATYDLADRCDDLEMLRDYLDVAGRWFSMAEALRTAGCAGRLDFAQTGPHGLWREPDTSRQRSKRSGVKNGVGMGRVLVVEDDHAICALIADILADAGLETECVQNDRSAYAIIPTLPSIAALIVDINLGAGTTGFDVARFARQVIPDLPVIYVSGEASVTSFKAFGLPESDFLPKPFTSDDLLAKLQPRLAA